MSGYLPLYALLALVVVVGVDGDWSDWYPWTPCSASCGAGTRSRERRCEGGATCTGEWEEKDYCFLNACVGPLWGPWSGWSECTSTCYQEKGTRTRWRECVGMSCTSRSHDIDRNQCRGQSICPVNGEWAQWGEWTACSATCGNGYRYRQRNCDNPEPRFNGNLCNGPSTQTSGCIAEQALCYKQARFGPWGSWEACYRGQSQAVCRERYRNCEKPGPLEQGSECDMNNARQSEENTEE